VDSIINDWEFYCRTSRILTHYLFIVPFLNSAAFCGLPDAT
jgi:hypothetical protein